jgi:RNA polymerase sigma factor (sigma-70 family)
MGGWGRDQEIALVRECLSGSEEAWQDFYCRYEGLVRHVVKKRLGAQASDHHEDVGANVFASLVSSLKNFDGQHSLARFIGVIAERKCIEHYRKNSSSRFCRMELADEDHQAVDVDQEAHHDSPEVQLIQAELKELLRIGWRGLSDSCRELLRMRYYDDLSYKEIGQMLGKTENALAVQANRCVNDLRLQIRGFMGRE